MHRRTALVALVTAGFVVLAFVPAVAGFGLGWLELRTTTIEGWALFALVYLVWMAGLTVLLVWAFDRIGHQWQYQESTPRPKKKQLRRRRATMQALNAERQATIEAMRRREEREARRRRARDRESRGGGER